MTATQTVLMVELHSGYGDGFGVVEVDADGKIETNPARKDGSPMDAWRQKILSASSIDLVDGGVRVPPGAVKRIIGPLDSPEAARVCARRFTKNWGDSRFVDFATGEELVAALASDDHATNALSALAVKYAETVDANTDFRRNSRGFRERKNAAGQWETY